MQVTVVTSKGCPAPPKGRTGSLSTPEPRSAIPKVQHSRIEVACTPSIGKLHARPWRHQFRMMIGRSLREKVCHTAARATSYTPQSPEEARDADFKPLTRTPGATCSKWSDVLTKSSFPAKSSFCWKLLPGSLGEAPKSTWSF